MRDIKEEIKNKFIELFDDSPIIIRSPGRVNLIGEHTDYNNGFVLPAAIDKAIYFAIKPNADDRCRLFSFDMNEKYDFSANSLQFTQLGWPNYLMGVVDQFIKEGLSIKGFDCVFGGDIPIGAGLSSSAAIEAGLAFAFNEMFSLNIDKLKLVKMAQKAENEFVGVKCGIMDQYINIFGAENKVLKIDCKTLGYEYHPFENDELRIVLCDTLVKHSLASSEYNVRRTQCESGVKSLQKYYTDIESLRDVTFQQLKKHQSEIEEIIFMRCKYVIEENERVTKACEDLERNDFVSFGKRMYESHNGLSNEYEVSCSELDLLVSIASKCEGVLGARMMGGGFGGCTINLVKKNSLQNFTNTIAAGYKTETGNEPKIHICKIEAGTSIIK